MTDAIKPESITRLLDQNDRQSITWRKLNKHLEERLQALRARNDTELDPTATAKLRGEISAVKNILALGEKAPDGVVDED